MAFVLLSASLAKRIYTGSLPKRIRNISWSPRRKLGECEGDCDTDRDCLGSLRCFQRTGNGPVPGCYGRAYTHYDFCVRTKSSPTRPRPSLRTRGPLKLHKCYRFESVNFRGQHIRHRNYQLWKDPGKGELYWKDSTFMVVPALNGMRHQVSFKSLNYPNNYLRHRGYNGYIHRCSTNLCRNDASWTVKCGLSSISWPSISCGKTVSFQSAIYPRYYLRHQNARVKISRRSFSTLYRLDASWIYHEVSCKRNFRYLGSRNGKC